MGATMRRKLLQNEEGIALVTALMLTLISMAIILALFYMMTLGIRASGAQKRYKTSLEASHGGAELSLKEIVPTIMRNYSSATLVAQMQADYAGIGLQVNTSQACLQAKLSRSSQSWPAACSRSLAPKQSPDLSFTLQAATGDPFTVYTKIVDTVKGNTDVSGLQLEGGGVAESSPVLTPQHYPYIYRLEVQGERSSNATEQANISALYAY
jgi:hypothetical protein